ncbi:hypothetical protein R3P38DRAFT_587867 [Favolaschia claudopus]|uniref:Uncharacterized protein n=1 Tax=Favolaschia claudopus TaxID=2862362 RepID=A0AAW0CAW5_9AGAR
MVRLERLPTKDEYRRVRHLVLQEPSETPPSDDDLATVFSECPHLETVVPCQTSSYGSPLKLLPTPEAGCRSLPSKC